MAAAPTTDGADWLLSGITFTDSACPGNLTYGDPVLVNYQLYAICTVPGSTYDGIIVAVLGVALFGVLYLRPLAGMWMFIIGLALSSLVFSQSTSVLSNGTALWLNIAPGDFVLYVFAPAMLLDGSLRVNFHVFKRYIAQSILLALPIALLCTALLVVFLLYGLGLEATYGWSVAHAALFGAVIVSTDAGSVAAIMSAAGAPESLDIVLRGESLFNAATCLVLFGVFLEETTSIYTTGVEFVASWTKIGEITVQILSVFLSGTFFGLGVAVLHNWSLSIIKRRPWAPEAELTYTLAVGYIIFYFFNLPYLGASSGAIALVVFGLYGAYTERFGLDGHLQTTGQFDSLYSTLLFVINGIVFLYSGMSAYLYIVTAVNMLGGATVDALGDTFWFGFLIYVAAFAFRFVAVWLCQPLFKLAGGPIGLKGTTFTTVAGLRGSLALILLRCVVFTPWDSLDGGGVNQAAELIKTQIVIWAVIFVLLTLTVNAPLLTPLLRILGLNQPSPGKRYFNQTVRRVYADTASEALVDLKASMSDINGSRINWELVERLQDMDQDLSPSDLDPAYPRWYHRASGWVGRACCCCFNQKPGSKARVAATEAETDPEVAEMDAWRAFPNLLCASFLPAYVGTNPERPTQSSASDSEPRVHRLTRFHMEGKATSPSGLQDGSGEDSARDIITEDDINSDARIRLLAILKRHFYGAYSYGHITVACLQTLNSVCDDAVFVPHQPFNICAQLQASGHSSLQVKAAEATLWALRQVNLRVVDLRGLDSWLYMAAVASRMEGLLHGLDAAVTEYAVALSSITTGSYPSQIGRELESEQRAASDFLKDRELESPETYYATVTHRAAVVMLRQKLRIINSLGEIGLTTSMETALLAQPVRGRLHKVRNSTAYYAVPQPRKRLESLPFLACLPETKRTSVMGMARQRVFEPGQTAWERYAPADPLSGGPQGGFGVVGTQSEEKQAEPEMLLVYFGMLQSSPVVPSPEKGRTCWGGGAVVGLLPVLHAADPAADVYSASVLSTARAVVPERRSAVSFPCVKALGLPCAAFREIRAGAAAGDIDMQRAEAEAFRTAALLELYPGGVHHRRLRREVAKQSSATKEVSRAASGDRERPPSDDSTRSSLAFDRSGGLSMSLQMNALASALDFSRRISTEQQLTAYAVRTEGDDLMQRVMEQVRGARLVQIPAGGTEAFSCDLVLLGGVLTEYSPQPEEKHLGEHSAFSFVVCSRETGATYTAGSSGALLLVCSGRVLSPAGRTSREAPPDMMHSKPKGFGSGSEPLSKPELSIPAGR